MPTFAYRARDAEGNLCQDTIEAENVRQATQALQARRLTVIEMRQRRGAVGETTRDEVTVVGGGGGGGMAVAAAAVAGLAALAWFFLF